jgi:hypothetical protein
MKCWAAVFCLASAIEVTSPITGFSQSEDRSRIIADATSVSYTAMQEREIAAEQGQGFVLGDTVGVAYFTSEPGGLRLGQERRRTCNPFHCDACTGPVGYGLRGG